MIQNDKSFTQYQMSVPSIHNFFSLWLVKHAFFLANSPPIKLYKSIVANCQVQSSTYYFGLFYVCVCTYVCMCVSSLCMINSCRIMFAYHLLNLIEVNDIIDPWNQKHEKKKKKLTLDLGCPQNIRVKPSFIQLVFFDQYLSINPKWENIQ